MLHQQIFDRFLRTLAHAEYGRITVISPEGKTYEIAGKSPGVAAHFHVTDWRAITAFALNGDIGLAEAYRAGWWESDDLAAVIRFGLENEQALESYIYAGFFSRLLTRFVYFFTRNSLKGSRRNIQAHYDLGNEFYRLWLDPSMTYSSAIFSHADDTLQQAQHNKYDRMIERLGRNSGNLLEIGCGWGGFAERALEKGDFGIKGITLSDEQQRFAAERLGGGATIALEDYRRQQGTYDHIVSIEMFEAVGEAYWPTYFAKVKSLLQQKGRAMIQTITIDDQYFESYRSGGDMIRSFIFPGGMLPSPKRFYEEAQRAGLRVADAFRFGKDYAYTLEQWLSNFDAKLPQIRALGYDEPFIRLWRLYLAACSASFAVGRTDVMQLELQHA